MLIKNLEFLIILFLLTVSAGFSQTYKTYNFNEFESFLHKQDDKVYVINFWATWCRPCVEEMPAFKQLHEKYEDKNVKVLLVSLDFGKNVQERIKSFQKHHDIKSEIIILDDPDSNKWIDKVNKKWSGALPATLIYSKDARMFYERSFDFNGLEDELRKFL